MEENTQGAPPESTIIPPKDEANPRLNFIPFLLIFSILGVLILIFCVGAWFYIQNLPKEVACTLEAKICPDGSSVGRSGPKCEFAPCPTTKNKSQSKKYTDRGGRFAFEYPEKYTIREQFGGDKNELYYYYLNTEEGQLRIEAGPLVRGSRFEQIDKKNIETINGVNWIIVPPVESCTAAQCGTLPSGYYFEKENYYIAALDMEAEGSPSPDLAQILSTFKFYEAESVAGQGCIIGGCSGELCLNESSKDTGSICVYKEEFACYKSAKCEKQTDGNCSWTKTDTLISCIEKSKK